MIEEKELSKKKYYLMGILVVFTIIMMLLFHIRSYYTGLFVFMIIFIFWLKYPQSLVYSLFWTFACGGVIEILIARKFLGVFFIAFALMFLLGKHVLVEDGKSRV
ncbi:MAG: hypothetical protein WC979_09650 [Candidatus Pacearchaeota archaeon]|jgi:hypothetical protein